MLARIQDSFHTMVMARSREGSGLIEIRCFYEELPLPSGVQERSEPADDNHSQARGPIVIFHSPFPITPVATYHELLLCETAETELVQKNIPYR